MLMGWGIVAEQKYEAALKPHGLIEGGQEAEYSIVSINNKTEVSSSPLPD